MKRGVKLQPNWNQELPRHWLDNNPVYTHFFNSFQMDFPGGETHVVKSVRAYRKEINNQQLLEDIDELSRQEAWHTKVHNDYNHWLESLGYDIPATKMESKYSDLGNLAGTVAAEHFTATMSDWLNHNSDLFDKMHPHFREIFYWHMDEESAHRAVSFDVWTSITNKIVKRHPKFKKTINRVLHKAMIRLTIEMLFYSIRNTATMLNKDKQLFKWRTLKDLASLLFSPKKGIILFLVKPHIDFFKEDFHPWKYAPVRI